MSFEPAQSVDNISLISSGTGGGGGGGGGTSGSVTIGTTVIPVGGSSTVLEGLTSVTSSIFNGNLNGTANIANNINLSNAALNQFYFPTFTVGLTGPQTLHTDSDISYNPSTNILRVVNISTVVGDLNLVPAGNINVQNRDILNVRTVFARTSIASGLVLQAGTSVGLPVITATPDQINLGSTVTNTPRENVKLIVAQSDNFTYGLSATLDALNYLAGTGRHEFYTNTDTLLVSINSIGLQVKPNLNNAGVVLTLGNSNVSAAVSTPTPNTIDMGASVSNTAGNSMKLLLFRITTESYGIGASNIGIEHVVTNTTKTHAFWIGLQRYMNLSNTALNLFTETTAVGLLNIGASALTSLAIPARINMGGTYSNNPSVTPKLVVLNNGTGIGATPTSQDYIVPNGSQHVFYVNGNEVVSINQQRLLVRGPGNGNGQGRVMQIGTLSSESTTTPSAVSLGGGLSSIPGSNPKLMILETTAPGTNAWGLGASSSAMEYMTTNSAAHSWYINSVLVMQMSSTGLNLQNNTITNLASLSVTSITVGTINGIAGSVSFAGGNLTGINALTASTLTASTITSPGDLVLLPTGSNVNFSNKNITNVASGTFTTINAGTVNTPILASTGNITINPLAQVDFSAKAILNISNITASGTVTAANGTFSNTITANTLNIVQITTLSGNLTLNATGTNITFSNKILSAIASLTVTGGVTSGSIVTTSITSPTAALIINSATADITFSGKNFINVGTISSGAITATSLTVSTITSASGNLVINPAVSTDFSNKALINISSISAAGTITANQVTVSTVSTNSIITVAGSLSLNPAGPAVTFNAKNLTDIADLTAVNVTATNSMTTPTLTSAVGNLIINSAGTDIGFSAKNLVNILSVTGLAFTGTVSVTTPLLQTSVGNISILPAGTDIIVTGKNINGANNISSTTVTTNTITTLSGPLTVNPAGTAVNFSNKNLTNVANIGAVSVTSSLINTTAGNLSLNPVGPSVDFNGKNIINAMFVSPGFTTINVDQVQFPTTTSTVTLSRGSTNDSVQIQTVGGIPGRLETGRVTSPSGTALSITSSTGFIDFQNGTLANVFQLNINRIVSNAVPLIIDTQGGFPINFSNKDLIGINTATITTINVGTLTGTNGSIDLGVGTVTLTPTASATVFTARLLADTQARIALSTADGLLFGGGSIAPDLRLRRTAASVLTLDQGSGTAATLDMTNGSITNVAAINRAGAITISTTAANGNISYSTNGSGNHIFNSSTGSLQVGIPITTITGNLVLNPVGTAVNISNKDLTGVGRLFLATTANNLGTIFQIGIQADGVTDTGTPNQINMGSSVAPANGGISMANQKLLIYSRNNGDFAGFTFTNDGYFVSAFSGPSAFQWRWANGGGSRMILDFNGNLSTTASVISPILGATTRVQTPLITTTAGNLTLNPAGTDILLSNKILTNGRQIILDETTTIVGNTTQKIQILRNGASSYGFGVQTGVLSYETPAASDSHVFYTGQTERLRINNTNMTVGVPLVGPLGTGVSFPNGLTTALINSGGNITMNTTGNLSRLIIQPNSSTQTTQFQFNRFIQDPLSPEVVRITNYMYTNAFATATNTFSRTESGAGAFRIGQLSTFNEQTGVTADTFTLDTISKSNVLSNILNINTLTQTFDVVGYTLRSSAIQSTPGSPINFGNSVITNFRFGMNISTASLPSTTLWVGSLQFSIGGIGGVTYFSIIGAASALANNITYIAAAAVPAALRPINAPVAFLSYNIGTNEFVMIKVYLSGDIEVQRVGAVTFNAGQIINFPDYISFSYFSPINPIP